VPRYVQARLAALGSDVVSSVEALAADYGAAQLSLGGLRTAVAEGRAHEIFLRSETPRRRMITTFKSVYMFVRAYQDALCGFLIELDGKTAGKYTSMSNHTKPGKAIRTLLDQELDGYVSWFQQWKEDRDRMKIGAMFAIGFDANNEMSLSFSYTAGTTLTVERREIRQSSVIEGLEMSERLTRFLLGRIDPSEVLYVEMPTL
jgi:hypothetical protein